jgi:hypothetical protein
LADEFRSRQLLRSFARGGHIDMRAQAEVVSARRTDTPRAIRHSALPASVGSTEVTRVIRATCFGPTRRMGVSECSQVRNVRSSIDIGLDGAGQLVVEEHAGRTAVADGAVARPDDAGVGPGGDLHHAAQVTVCPVATVKRRGVVGAAEQAAFVGDHG